MSTGVAGVAAVKTPVTFKAQSRDLREAARIALEPGEVVVWEGLADRRRVPLLAPWVVRGAVWLAAAVVVVLALLLSHRWWGGAIAVLVLTPAAVQLRRLQAWLGPLRRPYYAVTDRRLLMVEPDAYFGIEPGVTSYRAENLPQNGTLREHRIGNDLCLRYRLLGEGSDWRGLRSVPDADRVERMLAELKRRG